MTPPLSYPQVRALVRGLLSSDNATKQQLGQRFAAHLELTPGPLGPDDGVDGSALVQGRMIHFQSKLRSTPLDKDVARLYYSDVKYHRATVSVMLAGLGYKQTFQERLFGHPHLEAVRIHLLTLEDVFRETPAYRLAMADMPALAGLAPLASGPLGGGPPTSPSASP